MKNYVHILKLFTVVLLLCGALIAIACERDMDKPSPYTVTELQVPVPLPDISLLDHNGNEFGRWNFARKWSFVFFGYTNCPDVCPMALVDMDDIYQNLVRGGDLYNTQFIFISVDPERDTIEELKDYMFFFNREFTGVTGKPPEIAKIADKLGVSYMRVPGKVSEEDYLVDHSASILLIDPLTRMRAIFTPPHDADFMTSEFRGLRYKYREECCILDEEGETVIFDYRKKGEE